MPDPFTNIALQTPTSSVKNAGALQVNVNGQPYAIEHVIPCHPTQIDTEWVFTTGVGDVPLSAAPGAGVRLAVTQICAFLSSDTTAGTNVKVRIGWGATVIPPESSGGVGGILLHHYLTPGGGVIKGNGGAVVNLGPANTPLRLTCSAPTGGRLIILLTGFFPQIA